MEPVKKSSMKEINKLVHLVTHGLKSNFGVIDLSGEVKNPGKEQQLFNGVLDGTYHDDEVTAKGMYNSNIYDQRFRMLKSRLRYKLYDLLYYLDFEQPKYSYSVRKKLECKEYLHKAHILFELEEYGMAEKQYNKALVLASECQFIDEMIEANEIKRNVLAAEFKPTDFELTLDELARLWSVKREEDKAQNIFLKAELLLSKSIHSRNSNQKTTEHAIGELEAIYKHYPTYDIFEKIYKLKIWHFNLIQDFKALAKYLIEVPGQVEKMKVNFERFDKAKNNLILARTYLLSEKFEEGLEVARDGYSELDKSTNNWFNHAEVHFLLAIRSFAYNEAHEVLNSVLKNPNHSRSSDLTVNRWKIFKLYLNFAQPHLGIQKRIRFYDIYECSGAYFHESKSYKISLFILDFIHQLNRDSFDQAESKLDELEAFFYKNLNDPGKNQREKQLLKMLGVLRSSSFDVDQTLEKSATYLQRMTEKKTMNPFADVEIIAYEELWEMVLKSVSAKIELV